MNPKEKARELVSKYIHLTKQTTGANGTIYNSKKCALIAVDEIMIIIQRNTMKGIKHPIFIYFQEVKQEINKL